MKLWVVTAVVVILALVCYWAGNTLLKAKASKRLMEIETPYRNESADYAKTMLVLGDSTGVGVGAQKPEDTVAGLTAAYIGATYAENYAVSGAAVEELPGQIAKAKCDSYDLVLVHIGGNDILAGNDPKKVAPRLTEILKTLPQAGKVVVLSAGNVGGATIFPHVIRPFHMWLTLAYHKAFTPAVESAGGTYVNLYMPLLKDPFLRRPNYYLAPDGLHPSSAGYALWFEKVKEAL